MASTSPNFRMVLATFSDQVAVDSHVANNFTIVDSVMGAIHTGTGELKIGVTIVSPSLSSPLLLGTMRGGVVVSTTGSFQTITATGGSVTLNTLTVGNYAMPSTVGTAGTVLTVLTGNAVWAAVAPGTGANAALSNLSAVAINAPLGDFTASTVTITRVIATAGTLSGLTSIAATTGTFTANLVVTGTVSAAAVNCTGGTITAAGFAIGTYALPTTIGSTGNILTATTGNAVWLTPNLAQTVAYFNVYLTGSNTAAGSLVFDTKRFDTLSGYDTGTGGYTITASGYYVFGVNLIATGVAAATAKVLQVSLSGSGGPYTLAGVQATGTFADVFSGQVMLSAGSGNVYTVTVATTGSSSGYTILPVGGTNYPSFWGYKIPDV